nr:phosphoglucosamine mutase [bacterium]
AAAVSASHNPYQDNGIKLFSGEGFKLSDAEEQAIEAAVLDGNAAGPLPTGAGVGVREEDPGACDRYCAFCRGTWPLETDLEGIKLVLDCGNGATFRCAPEVFRELGADVVVINDRPDGVNINADCGSQFTAGLKKAVIARGADAGLAFDGDGDRLIAVDETGTELTGDHALVVCARLYRELGLLKGDLVVSTVMSNFGLDEALGKLGVRREETAVGDRYVLEAMRERGAVIGAEASGHMIFLDRHTTGDGIVSGLQLLAAVRRFGEPLSRLASEMRMFPQTLVNVEVARKPPLEELPELTAAAAAAEAELAGRGRVLIRYSGTQNLCRVMVEGPDPESTERTARSLARLAERLLG